MTPVALVWFAVWVAASATLLLLASLAVNRGRTE